jgi:ABC-type sugar transport system permease subunit
MSDTLLSPRTDPSNKTANQAQKGLLSSRRRRIWREYLTAYVMIAPAVILIFIFGIFPVAFALYVSIHKWRLVRSDFLGITNYEEALGNLIYTVLFLLGAGCLFGAYVFIRRARQRATENEERPWLFAIPTFFYAATIIAFGRWAFLQLPEVLDIADKIRGLEKTRELFMSLLSEAFRAETVQPAWQLFISLFLVSILLAVLFNWFIRTTDNIGYQAKMTGVWLAAVVGIGLLRTTFQAIQTAYNNAIETGTDPGIWPQLIMLSAGVLLLIIGWKVWGSIEHTDSNRAFIIRSLVTCVLLVGAVLLIIEIPTIVASGDEDLWQGLKVTIFFSMGTVPVQLTIALLLAILLYQ